jgi:hypothetical protein
MEKNLTTIEDLGALNKRTMAGKEETNNLRTGMKAGFKRIENLLPAEKAVAL